MLLVLQPNFLTGINKVILNLDLNNLCAMQRGKTLKGAAAFNYVIKPAPTGALILEATATELIQFSPFNILNGAAQVEAR